MSFIKKHHILIISIMVFIVLNIIENYFHYNVGRNATDGNNFILHSPSIKDWGLIVFIMMLFALLQGYITEYFAEYY